MTAAAVIALLVLLYVGIRTWQKTLEIKWGGVRPVSVPERMRRLRFRDIGDGYWYKCDYVGDNTSFNLKINPMTGSYSIDVLDELFGQKELYGRMRPEYRDAITREIDARVDYYRSLGFDIHIDHAEYGVKKNEEAG